MKVFLTKTLLLFVSMLISSCGSTSQNGVKSCQVNTTKKSVNFILVVINKNGLPTDALVPTTPVKKLDLRDANLRLSSIVDPKICPSYPKEVGIKSDHVVHRKEQICFVAVEVSSNKDSKYKFSSKKIAVLWRPDKIAEPKSNIVELTVPKHSPDGIAYKFTIATKKSDTEKPDLNGCSTYLDPRIVIRRL